MSEANGPLLIKSSGNPAELVELLEWFRHEGALRGQVSLSPEQTGGEQTGEVAGALMVTVGAGGAAAVLVHSLTAWLTRRRSETTITITRGDAVVTVSSNRIQAAELLRTMQDLLDEQRVDVTEVTSAGTGVTISGISIGGNVVAQNSAIAGSAATVNIFQGMNDKQAAPAVRAIASSGQDREGTMSRAASSSCGVEPDAMTAPDAVSGALTSKAGADGWRARARAFVSGFASAIVPIPGPPPHRPPAARRIGQRMQAMYSQLEAAIDDKPGQGVNR
ncbi:effector-associated constant component EACC1 [Nocardia sp. NPDC003979]